MKLSTKKVSMYLSMATIALTSFAPLAQEGENLVNNGSFESMDKKPKRLGQIESATGWVSPTGVRADLFIDGKLEEIGTPYNAMGKEDPKDGENYAGIVAYSYGNKMPRSYVMTKLNTPLKKGIKYCVKFYISLAEGSKYASNNVAAHIGKKPFGSDAKISIIETPSVRHAENDYETVTSRYGWTEVCGVFIADGGEKYITIGNFNSDEETRNERMKKDPKVKDVKVNEIIAAYYYIDDVSVRLIDEEKGEKCDCTIEVDTDAYSTMIFQKVVNVSDDMTPQEKIESQKVYFAFGKSQLSVEGKKSLDMIAAVMKANPEAKLKIVGHNNAQEDEVGMEKEVYQDMDNKRIAAVMEYLVAQGIAEARLIPTRKRAEAPNAAEENANDDDEVKQAKDRRVEFQLK